MRLFDKSGKEIQLQILGEVDVTAVAEAIFAEFDPLAKQYETSEYVFANTFRICGANEFYDAPQKYSEAEREERLNEILQPLVEFLKQKLPDHTPVLMQCAAIPPHTSLKFHVDTYVYQSVSYKCHFPILTNDKAFYQVFENDTLSSYNFEVGKVYTINNILYHRAVNNGDTPRIHVIIDMMPNDKLQEFRGKELEFFHTLHDEHKRQEAEHGKKLYRARLKSKLKNKNDTRLLDNFFLNGQESSFQVREQFNEVADVYFAENGFDSALCIVDGMCTSNPSTKALMSLVGDKKPKDIYFVHNQEFEEALSPDYDVYKVDRVAADDLSDIEFVNENVLMFMRSSEERVVMKACLKQELRNV